MLGKRIVQAEFAVGAGLLSVIVVLVFVASLARFAGHPIIWSVDLAQLLFIWLCFIGAVRAMRERAHLGVDLIVRRFSHRNRLIIETVLAAVFIVFLGVLAKVGYDLTILNKERQFGDSGLSYAYVTISVPVGCVLLGLAIVDNTVQSWRKGPADRLIFARTEDAGV